MIDPEKIIYSINIEDIQNVAEQELERKLTAKELKLVEGKFIDDTACMSFRCSRRKGFAKYIGVAEIFQITKLLQELNFSPLILYTLPVRKKGMQIFY
ncbi:MAG: hypothetical protein NG747_02235 [Candidatus Brocadia sp.]|nr:hypothetical protein [Candidatus Brocadia sp.]